MVDVLLVHSYFLKYDSKQREKQKPYPPLATLYAASFLRQEGYSVTLFDAMLSEGEHEFEEVLEHCQPMFVVIYEDSFNFLIKMCLSRMRQAAQTMSRSAREAGATVIAASPDVSDHPEFYFSHGVQYALIGEADHTLLELLHVLKSRNSLPLTEIAGLAWPDADQPDGIYRTTERHPERHLDCFPFPAWDLLDVEKYRKVWMDAHGYFSLNMVGTRGCPFHCNWCAKPIWGQRYAMRSPVNVAAEMSLIKRELKPDHIWFADDIFGLRPRWVTDFAEIVRELDAVIPFTIQSRVDLMTERAVAGLALAGCTEVWMGAESGSQQILDAMDKGTELTQIATARERLKQAGIKANFFLQFGYPGESFEDIMSTVQMVRDTLPDNIGVSVSYPLPGTKFHGMVAPQLGAKTNWTDSNDLAMMFQGTYRSPFYRHLHNLIHRDLELRQKLASGIHSVEIFALLDQLNAEWCTLGRVESEHRSLTPTIIKRLTKTPAPPDLSKEWN